MLLLPSSESGSTIVPSVVQYTKDGKVVVGEAAKVRVQCHVPKHKLQRLREVPISMRGWYASHRPTHSYPFQWIGITMAEWASLLCVVCAESAGDGC